MARLALVTGGTRGIGAAIASFTFFTTLGFGARLLAPALASIRAWRILEVLIGATMWGIAAGLPWGQWDESWAIPTSIALILLAAVAIWGLPKIRRWLDLT